MFFRLYGLINFGDDPFGINQKGDPFDPHIFPSHKFLFSPNVVGFYQFFLFVGQKGEGEGIFFYKFGVTLYRIDTDAKNLNIVFLKIFPCIANAAGLFGATRGVIFRIKIEQHPFSAILRKGVLPAGLIGQGKIGGLFSNSSLHMWLIHLSSSRPRVVARGRLQSGSSYFNNPWIPAFAGMTSFSFSYYRTTKNSTKLLPPPEIPLASGDLRRKSLQSRSPVCIHKPIPNRLFF